MPASSIQNLSLLIVEDSVTQREFIASICAQLGVTDIACAGDGQVALNMIDQRDTDFDLLICDLEMPDLDGIELIHQLASRHKQSALIILSAREQSLIASVELMATTEGLWVLAALQKPLKAVQLNELIEQYLQRCQHMLPPKAPARLELSYATLQQSLDEQRFTLHFQPKINMQNGQLAGAEALVRLQLSPGMLIFPNDFIPQCEQYKLIDQLSYTVIQLAIEQKRQWRELGLKIPISINLSPVSFDNEDFCARVIELIRDFGHDANDLTFEVTETAVIQDIGKALSILARLRLFGSGLSVDDYGTGYSSIKQLLQIPFTELKLDRSLIDGIASKAHLKVIFDSTFNMCSSMGLNVVAEGIESKEDWDYLATQGCHVGQGYYYSPPLPAEDFIQWWQAGMPAMGG